MYVANALFDYWRWKREARSLFTVLNLPGLKQQSSPVAMDNVDRLFECFEYGISPPRKPLSPSPLLRRSSEEFSWVSLTWSLILTLNWFPPLLLISDWKHAMLADILYRLSAIPSLLLYLCSLLTGGRHKRTAFCNVLSVSILGTILINSFKNCWDIWLL